MSNGAAPVPEEIYATLASQANELMVQKLFQGLTVAFSQRVKRMHLLVHTTGGFIGDGVVIYNFLRKLPFEVITYNGGWIQSVGVVAFLGAKQRKASKTATFMIHRSHFSSGVPASSQQLQAIADSLTIHDRTIETILRAHITMPDDKWEIHKHADLHMTADDALKYGLIDEIADFEPPLGATIFNVV